MTEKFQNLRKSGSATRSPISNQDHIGLTKSERNFCNECIFLFANYASSRTTRFQEKALMIMLKMPNTLVHKLSDDGLSKALMMIM